MSTEVRALDRVVRRAAPCGEPVTLAQPDRSQRARPGARVRTVNCADEIVRRARSLYGARLHGLFAFGSRIAGGARPDSDLDVAVWLDGSFRRRDSWLPWIDEFGASDPLPDPTFITTASLDSPPSWLLEAGSRSGSTRAACSRRAWPRFAARSRTGRTSGGSSWGCRTSRGLCRDQRGGAGRRLDPASAAARSCRRGADRGAGTGSFPLTATMTWFRCRTTSGAMPTSRSRACSR